MMIFFLLSGLLCGKDTVRGKCQGAQRREQDQTGLMAQSFEKENDETSSDATIIF